MIAVTLRRMIPLVGMAFMAGCAAEGPEFQAMKPTIGGQGMIYVYRPKTPIGTRGEDPYIEIAGKDMGRLKSGGNVGLAVPAGEHDVTIRQNLLFIPTIPRTITVAVAAGGSAYVRADQRITELDASDGGARAMQAVFIEEVSLEQGQEEIGKTRGNN
jgi:hypothetical protein